MIPDNRNILDNLNGITHGTSAELIQYFISYPGPILTVYYLYKWRIVSLFCFLDSPFWFISFESRFWREVERVFDER